MGWTSRLLQIWAVVCIVLVMVAFATSEGEPICRGPLILSVDDSDPPQCDDPIAGFLPTAPLILGAGLVVTGLIAGITVAMRRLVSDHS